jgi:hypothetical protein
MNRFEKKVYQAIQAIGPEGIKDEVQLESLLTHSKINTAISGVTNNYKDYNSQVLEAYRKYNGISDWGNQQARAIIDFRTAFIAGEGISISCDDSITSEFIEKFIEYNLLNGSFFINAVKATEICGQTIYQLTIDKDNKYKEGFRVHVTRYPYDPKKPYRPQYLKSGNSLSLIFKIRESQVNEKILSLPNSIPVVTGGDDLLSHGPTTKIGLTLNDIENYDRAVKDIRRLNHVLARITPTVQVENQKEVKATMSFFNELRWKIGQMFVGTGKFKYEVPSSSAHDNLKVELVTTIKNISAITGIPIHWLGYVDLMSNRSTADSLYEVIKNATINERTIHAEAIYNLLVKAQELYIDNGGTLFNKINYDFEVKLPLIDYASFYDKVRALSVAFHDGAISMADYRNEIPGIDPLETEKQVEKEQEADISRFLPPDIETNEELEND